MYILCIFCVYSVYFLCIFCVHSLPSQDARVFKLVPIVKRNLEAMLFKVKALTETMGCLGLPSPQSDLLSSLPCSLSSPKKTPRRPCAPARARAHIHARYFFLSCSLKISVYSMYIHTHMQGLTLAFMILSGHNHTRARARTHARTHTRTHACMHARTHACMHACTHARTHARTYARTHACTHTRARARVYAPVCSSTHTHLHILFFTHTHSLEVALSLPPSFSLLSSLFSLLPSFVFLLSSFFLFAPIPPLLFLSIILSCPPTHSGIFSGQPQAPQPTGPRSLQPGFSCSCLLGCLHAHALVI